jgi:hypothetical protein
MRLGRGNCVYWDVLEVLASLKPQLKEDPVCEGSH